MNSLQLKSKRTYIITESGVRMPVRSLKQRDMATKFCTQISVVPV